MVAACALLDEDVDMAAVAAMARRPQTAAAGASPAPRMRVMAMMGGGVMRSDGLVPRTMSICLLVLVGVEAEIRAGQQS